MNVTKLKIGGVATVEKLCFDEIPLALMEIGCLPGNRIKIIQKAPCGCPIYLEVAGSHFALRAEDCKKITVKKTRNE